jgi:Zn-dependent M16 (insulinase) family peptidase
MNTIEFRLREGGGGLRGMEIFLASLSKWNYDLNPADALVYEDALKALKDEISRTGSNTFQQMIRDFLITNNHRVVLELYPSTTLEADQLKVKASSCCRRRCHLICLACPCVLTLFYYHVSL